MVINFSIEDADLSATASVIEALWLENLSGYDRTRASAKMALGYLNNPAGPGNILVLNVDGRQQGTLGLHPRAMHLGTRPLRAVVLADFAVSRKHRSVKPALMLMRHAASVGAIQFDLIYGEPNVRAAPIFRMAGFKCIGDRRRFAKPTAIAVHLVRYLPQWAARLCAPLLDMAIDLVDRVRYVHTWPRLICRAGDWADPALDQVWACRPKDLLLSDRSARMLHWRFGAAGREQWQLCLAYDNDSTLHGYVAWRQVNGTVEIGDFFTIDPLKETTALMRAFTRWIKGRGTGTNSISVEFFGCPVVVEQLKSAGLILRPQPNPVFVGKDVPSDLCAPEQWFLTAFDSDAD